MKDNMNNNSKRTTTFAVVAGIALVLGIAGCNGAATKKQVSNGEKFIADDQPRSVNKFADAQISSGARADSTLTAAHFDGGQLNSLGRAKLRAMLKDDDACEPLNVYMDLKGTGESTAKRESVTAFLLDEGLLESQIALKEGSNPLNTTSAAKALEAQAAGESAPTSGSGSAAAPGASAGVTATK